MSLQKVDLFLGSDIGLWALQQISEEHIGQVFTLDNKIAVAGQNRGIKIYTESPDTINFNNSKLGFSVHYPRILTRDIIIRYQMLYNLHPGYLPWGRGFYPIFWAMWEQAPAGATLHEITENVDEGPIVERVQVEYSPYETGDSVYMRVREVEKALFLKYWQMIIDRKNIPSSPQPMNGSYHSKKEFFELKENLDLDSISCRDLVRLARCLTFTGYTGLEVTLEDNRFEICIKEICNKSF